MKSSNLSIKTGRHLVAAVVLALAAGGVGLVQASSAGDGSVGKVTLVLGKALIVDAAGVATPVQRGASIHTGDRVETAEGGHVHIRFVDGALVSVRPTSRLVVEDYQYDAKQVDKSLVRFRLDQGVARAISGAAAEGARDRFRLNTPLVAIGVRGTDFVVRADPGQALASVNQGAIVMAPFGDGCQPQSTGPCGSSEAKLLTATMGQMFVEYRDHLTQPEIKPVNTMLAGDATAPVALASVSSRTAASDQQVFRETRKSDETGVVALMQGTVSQIDGVIKKPTPPIVVDPSVTLPTIPAVPDATAALVWGRYENTAGVSNDISIARLEAMVGRRPTVQNSTNNYILYRDEVGPNLLSRDLGSLSFGLSHAQAVFVSPSGVQQAASVLDGRLQIDFAGRKFDTWLNLTSVPTGDVRLEASSTSSTLGDGIFNARSSGQAVAGAVALDAKSAGYFFEKAAAGGTLSGITLWGR